MSGPSRSSQQKLFKSVWTH